MTKILYSFFLFTFCAAIIHPKNGFSQTLEMLTAISDTAIPIETRAELAQRMISQSDSEIAHTAVRVASQSEKISVRRDAVTQYKQRAGGAHDKVITLMPVLLSLPVEDDDFAVSIAREIIYDTPLAREAVKAITAAYTAPEPVVRARAARLISVAQGKWGDTPWPYALLDDPSPRVRLWACIVLERLGEHLAQAGPLYEDTLDSPIISDQMAAIDALISHREDGLKTAPNKLLKLSQGKDPNIARKAKIAYAQIAPASEETVNYLIDMLKGDTRGNAIIALGLMGEYARPAIPLLIEFISQKNTLDRNDIFNIFRTLSSLNLWANEALPTIRSIAEDTGTDDNELRRAAILTLANFPLTPENETLFTKLITDASLRVQNAALIALRDKKILPDKSVEAVLTALHSKSTEIRMNAVIALAHTQSQFSVVGKALQRCLDDSADIVRMTAVRAFHQNQGLRDYRPPITTLLKTLEDASEDFQGSLLQLMEDKDLSADQLTLIKPLALSARPRISEIAMNIWIRAANRDPAVLDDLLAHLDNVNDQLSTANYASLSRIQTGSKDRRIDAFLIAKLDSSNDAMVSAALFALNNRGSRLAFDNELATKVIALLHNHPTQDVRRAGMALIGRFARLDEETVFPLFVEMLTANDSTLGFSTQNAFKKFINWTPTMVATLVDQTASVSPSARLNIITILATVNTQAADPLIRDFLDSEESDDTLRFLLSTLNNNQMPTSAILPQLKRIAQDEHRSQDLRSAAILAMKGAGEQASEIMPMLRSLLAQPEFTNDAAQALGYLGPAAVSAVPDLRKVLLHSDVFTASVTLNALARIGPDAVAAVPDIQSFLQPNQSIDLRRAAINALRLIAPPSRELALALVPLISDRDTVVANSAVRAISAIGKNLSENGRASARRDLDALFAAVAQQDSNNSTHLQETLSGLRQRLEPTAWENIVENVLSNKVVQSIFLVLFAYVSWLLFLVLLWFAAPLTVHRLARFTRSNPFSGATNLLMPFLLLYHFEATKRVVDIWVEHNLVTLRQRCADSFSKNTAYMALPIRLKDGSCTLDATLMRRLLAPEQPILAVLGEGGIGKTTLAAHFARSLIGINTPNLFDHAVIPVLLDLGLTGETLVETLRQKLAALSGEELGTSFLLAMLRSRRVFTIVDALSELPTANQRKLINEMEAHPEGGFIITSRLADPLGQLRFTEVQLSVLQSSMLAEFVDYRLQLLQRDDAISQTQRYEACIKIVDLMAGRPATPLLAGMYIDLFADAAFEGEFVDLPRTIPDLILSFVNTMNKQVYGDEVSEWKVRQAMMIVARRCIEPEYFPQRGIEDELGQVLEKAGLPSIDYLVNNTLLMRMAPRYVSIRYDTVCEYLAAIAIVEDSKTTTSQWDAVVVELRKKTEEDSNVSGFVRALRDVVSCYVTPSARAAELLKQLP